MLDDYAVSSHNATVSNETLMSLLKFNCSHCEQQTEPFF
jgi:hypothetical protein